MPCGVPALIESLLLLSNDATPCCNLLFATLFASGRQHKIHQTLESLGSIERELLRQKIRCATSATGTGVYYSRDLVLGKNQNQAELHIRCTGGNHRVRGIFGRALVEHCPNMKSNVQYYYTHYDSKCSIKKYSLIWEAILPQFCTLLCQKQGS